MVRKIEVCLWFIFFCFEIIWADSWRFSNIHTYFHRLVLQWLREVFKFNYIFQVLNRSMDPKTYLAPLIAQLPPPVQYNLLPQVCAYHFRIYSRENARHSHVLLSIRNVALRATTTMAVHLIWFPFHFSPSAFFFLLSSSVSSTLSPSFFLWI